MSTNIRTVLAVRTLARPGMDILKARPDVEVLTFEPTISPADFLALIGSRPRVHGLILGLTRVAAAEIAACRGLEVAARIGVGYDTVDVPALTAARVPLMITGTANSPSVAEQAVFFMLAFAKRGAALDRMVREGRWMDRLKEQPVDLNSKTVLVVGFGRIGSRTTRLCRAFDMAVMVHDPYVAADAIRAAGAEPLASLDAGLPRADFLTLHCPRMPETERLIDVRRLALMKPSAVLVNTARGGIVDEAALHAALAGGRLFGAGLDVFDIEPAAASHPLLKLPNVMVAPHMAGVTKEAFDRMAAQAAANVLSVFDGKVLRHNVVNGEVVGV